MIEVRMELYREGRSGAGGIALESWKWRQRRALLSSGFDEHPSGKNNVALFTTSFTTPMTENVVKSTRFVVRG
jgi:hypothetical protein